MIPEIHIAEAWIDEHGPQTAELMEDDMVILAMEIKDDLIESVDQSMRKGLVMWFDIVRNEAAKRGIL